MNKLEQYFVNRWFKRIKPIILIKDKKTDKTLDMLDLIYFVDKVIVLHNGVFTYKSSNGKERETSYKNLNKHL